MKCRDCVNALFYLWAGEQGTRTIVSCREYLPVNNENCKLYERKCADEV